MSFDPKWNSRTITDGRDRAAARSYFYSIGLTKEDIAKPIIGIANTWIGTMPCNFNLRALAAKVARRRPQGRRHAAGVQHDRHQRRHHDGHRGHEDVARLARADRRLDRAVRARLHVRRARLPRRLRQDDPGGRDGARAAQHPRHRPLRRLDHARQVRGPRRQHPGRLRGRRPERRRHDLRRGPRRASSTPPARARAPAAASSPPTRWRWRWSSSASRRWAPPACPAVDPRKDDVGVRAGELVMDVLRRNQRPLDILTRQAFENAIAGVAATGGSTNAVLHLLAHRARGGRAADHRRLRRRQRPHAAASPTSSPAAATSPPTSTAPAASSSSHAASSKAASPTARRRRRPAPFAAASASAVETPGQDVVRPLANPLKATGGLVILHGNLAPEGCVDQGRRPRAPDAPRPGARLRPRRGRDGRRHRPQDQARRRRRHPLRRPEGRPRHARDARRHVGDRRRGPGRDGGAAHRRPLQRRHARPDGRPRRAGSATSAARSPPCATATRSASTSRTAASTSRSATTRWRPACATGARRSRATPPASWPSTPPKSRAPAKAPSPARAGESGASRIRDDEEAAAGPGDGRARPRGVAREGARADPRRRGARRRPDGAARGRRRPRRTRRSRSRSRRAFVSRGGEKLDHALTAFGLDVRGRVALDVGASTGGFTDCLLQRGAAARLRRRRGLRPAASAAAR